MQGSGMSPQPSRGVAIPGARPDGGAGNERWRVALQSGGSDAGASLSASVQEGFFGSSLRQQSTDQGYSHSTFGSLKGHGAWLSSSPHPNMRAFPHRPPLHRTPSLQARPEWCAIVTVSIMCRTSIQCEFAAVTQACLQSLRFYHTVLASRSPTGHTLGLFRPARPRRGARGS